MSLISGSVLSCSQKHFLAAKEKLAGVLSNVISTRFASKKTGGSSKNHAGVVNPKHRGIKYNNGRFVQQGTLLVTQNKLRFHPGLNVGMGGNGTLFALVPGRVAVSTEKVEPNMDHTWNQRTYGGRDLDRVYKKYFHVFPTPQHVRFKRIA
ncbi:hypothetical protein GE061_013819 [Apolygus lucorum]|uniref:Large ribosomal subunit protein bL27m n=1 Tax=Apolygus lucorum TaxID=248454 RepID=A0A6A4K6F4_APOLU|nr:hypothetical protein GE061_013819 [Apolygus lucorum]